MNVDQAPSTQPDTATETPVNDKTSPLPESDQAAEARRASSALTLRSIGVSEVSGPGMNAFVPQSMGEAMELAKMMADSNFVPEHLRGKRGDCLAVIMQATRWSADPFAVANKSYFVNNRMAFEAQLVAAVVNTSKVLDGRLQVSWQGTVGKPGFQCTVRGKIKGDNDIHELIQEMDTITTRNSPLWKQSQRVQLGYYTMRAWSRLYTPEVLLGIYTPDELESNPGAPGTQTVIPPRPTRAALASQAQEFKDAEARANGRIPDEPEHDAETGEIIDESEPQPEAEKAKDPEPEQAQPEATVQAEPEKPAHDYQPLANKMIEGIRQCGSLSTLKGFEKKIATDLDVLRTDAKEQYEQVTSAIEQKKQWFAR